MGKVNASASYTILHHCEMYHSGVNEFQPVIATSMQ